MSAALRALRAIPIDLGLAVALAFALQVAGCLVALLADPAGWAPRENPFAERTELALRLESVDDPAATAILAEARAAAPAAEHALVVRDGRVWLVAIDARDAAPATRGPLVRGAWTGEIVLQTQMFHAFTNVAGDAGGWLARHPFLAAWVLVSGGLGLLAVGAWRRRGHTSAEARAPAAHVLGRGLATAGAAFAVTWAVAVATELLGVTDVEQTWVVELARGSPAAFAVLAVAAVVVAPAAEETFFRGHLFARLLPAVGRAPAYAISAALFAAVHFNPPAAPQYFAHGVVLAWAYERWRSLGTVVVAHAAVNAVGIAWLRFA